MKFQKAIILLLLACFLLSLAPEAAFAVDADTTAPIVNSVKVDGPYTVNRGESVTLTLNVTEEGSGIRYLFVHCYTYFDGLPREVTGSINFDEAPYTGPGYSGDYQITINTHESNPKDFPGVYRIGWVEIEDYMGLKTIYSWNTPDAYPNDGENDYIPGFSDNSLKCVINGASTFTVNGEPGEDLIAPTVNSATVLTAEAGKTETLRVSLDVTEEGSGFHLIKVFIKAKVDGSEFFYTLEYSNPDPANPKMSGTYLVTSGLSVSFHPGTYYISSIEIGDQAGNQRIYSNPNTYASSISYPNDGDGNYIPCTSNSSRRCAVQGAGTITINPDPGEDLTAPLVTGIEILTDSVYRPGRGAVAFDVIEEDSGIVSMSASFVKVGETSSVGFSANVTMGTDYPHSGRITGTFEVPLTGSVGEYFITEVRVRDYAGNERRYSTLGSYYSVDGEDEYIPGYQNSNRCVIKNSGTVEVSYEPNVEVVTSIVDQSLISKINAMPEGKAAIVNVTNPNTQLCTEAMLNAIKGKNKTLIFYCYGTQWAFNGLDITGTPKAIRMSVTMEPVEEGQYGFTNRALKAAFYSNGDLPGAVSIRLQNNMLTQMNEQTGVLFLYYLEDGTPVREDSSVSYYENGIDGWCKFYLNHNSTFVISNARTTWELSRVTGAAAATASYNSVRVAWNAVSGASGYQLYRATSQNGTYSLLKTTSSLSYTNTSLSTGRTYYYKVRAYRTVGSKKVYGGYSSIVSAAPKLSSVTTPTASAYYPTSIKISWNSVSGRTRYEIWRGTTADTSKFTKIGTTSSTYYKDTTCTPFVTYYYQIKVYRTVSGQKVYSSSASPTASARPILNNVTGVKAAMSSASSIKISWSSVTGASGYEVLRSTSPDSGFAVIKSTSSRSYTDSNRIPNTTYYYRVQAYRKVGSSRVYSMAMAASATPYFGPVTGAKAVMASAGSIKISWKSVSGRTGYEIYRSTAPDGVFTLIKTTTSTSYTNTNLVPNTTYYYKVLAYRTVSGTKYRSQELAVVTAVSATPYFGAATNPKAVRSSSTKIKISWSAVSGRTGYEIWRSTTPDPAGFTLLKSTTSTSYTNSGLTTGVTYYYKIRAYRTVNSTRYYSAFTPVVSAAP